MADILSLLTLLAKEANHGYGIKLAFERATGMERRLNVGQVYTTLGRLESRGFLEKSDNCQSNRILYSITSTGLEEVLRWIGNAATDDGMSLDGVFVKTMVIRYAFPERLLDFIAVQAELASKVVAECNLRKNSCIVGSAVWLRFEAKSRAMQSQKEWLQIVESESFNR